jgi:uncharacterized protein (TIGR02246 family)
MNPLIGQQAAPINFLATPLSSDRVATTLQPPACMTDDERAIKELIETWMSASTAGETETVLSLMSEDVVFLTVGREPFGRKDFAATQAAMKGAKIKGKADVREVHASGDIGYAWSHLDVSVTQPDGTTTNRRGYALTVFRRLANDRWVLARDANLLGA